MKLVSSPGLTLVAFFELGPGAGHGPWTPWATAAAPSCPVSIFVLGPCCVSGQGDGLSPGDPL